jgi:hypothetical protein
MRNRGIEISRPGILDPRSGINIPDQCGISKSLVKIFGLQILKKFFFPDPGSGTFLTLDPGWKVLV